MARRAFPPASVDQVVGLVRVLHSLGGRADAYKVDEEVEVDLGDLSLAIEAAKALGLIAVEGGDLELTDLGERLAESDIGEVEAEVGRRLAEMEPFAELISAVRSRGSMELGEAENLLCRFGYCDEVSARRVLNWGVLLGVIEVTGDDKVLLGKSAGGRDSVINTD